MSECGRKTDDCECKIGQIKTTSSLENVKINLDLFVFKKSEGSPYPITERRVPELIAVHGRES